MSQARLAAITASLAYSGKVEVFGDLSRPLVDSLRRLGVSVRTNPETAASDSTVVSFCHTDSMDADGLMRFMDSVSSAGCLVLHGVVAGHKDRLEELAFRHGFRVHPSYFLHVGYSEAVSGYWSILEKIGVPALQTDNIETAGPPSEQAHRAMRYVHASAFVRPGDTVIDWGSGSGDGTHILRTITACEVAVGLDASLDAVAHASECFRQAGLNFQVHDGRSLSGWDDGSADVVVCYGALDGVGALHAAAVESHRVLRPSGRLIIGIPLRPSQNTSKAELVASLGDSLLIEAIHVQSTSARTLASTTIDAPEPVGDWLIVVAYRDPVSSSVDHPFKDTIYPYPDPTRNLLAFDRDYKNPWLMRSLFGMGVRVPDKEERMRLAERVASTYDIRTPDHGAALCVIGYGVLEDGTRKDREAFLARAEHYVSLEHLSPHGVRWQVSIQFLIGLLEQASGNEDKAISAYRAVVNQDWKSFSPTLGTKAAEAALRIGMLSYCRGDLVAARRAWTDGLEVARSVFSSGFDELVGDIGCPLPDAFPEAISALEIARKCADCLRSTSKWSRLSAYSAWKSMIDERTQDRLKAMGLASTTASALVDASKWRRLERAVRSIPFLSPVLRLLQRRRA
ncbi:class I SAM-dependent methyltransferase [Pararhizobium sp. BT-229]|uniref:class I SAM-dependent methyltransferase n=1 Tax=Pararhizobium sp. BT-229 TaxID=2986923 RepID=UPI0021F7B85C|nr:class I SAM-dependent methyltransferase [Pararhizobium sp. BT-229]MCV9963904.1 class I SAM-dependent methyltransferase [Pararhizobium sp. BT-229]